MTRRFSLTSSQRIVLSFALVILVGSLLLSLPVFQRETSVASYWDHLFTAVSMVCVTGLFTQPVASTYTTLGQVVCMLLIQIGGLSWISFLGLFALRGGRRLRFMDLTTLQEIFNRSDTKHFRRFLRSVFAFTFGAELIGGLLLSFALVPQLGWQKGLFSSLFLSVSAFCNAGFDNLGNTSLIAYADNPLINLTLAVLIIMGGLGFSVWFDLYQQLKKRGRIRHLHTHTKVVLLATALLLVLGSLVTFLTEYTNPDSIGRLPLGQQVLASFFQTVTMRTAGFATLDYTSLRPITLLLYILQMGIGGAPGGTAGGIKITACLTLLCYARSEVLGLSHTNFGTRTLDPATIRKAFATGLIFLAALVCGLLALSLTDPHVSFLSLLFEAMSALATVGVTANLTPLLSQAGQAVLMVLMFLGRVGPISLLISLSLRTPSKKESLRYARSPLIV